MKKLYYANKFNGFFQQEIELEVPDNFSIPDYATEEPVPVLPEGKKAKLVNKAWVEVDDPDFTTVYSVTTGKEVLVKIDSIPENTTKEKKPSTKHIFFEGKWLLDSEIREILYQRKYSEINSNVREKVVNGYESNVTGQTLIYDSDMHDQQNIKTMADLGIDRKLRVKKDGVKTSVFHTNEQMKKLVEDFAQYVIEKTDQGALKKDTLTTSYLTIPLEELKNFDTSIT